MQIFISHSSADAKAAANICELLERSGHPCFIAPRDIRSGREYAEELINGIDSSTAMILLMSENANHSPHVLREVERAVSKSIPILVYKLEEVTLTKSMEYFLMTHQWINAQEDRFCLDILRFADDMKPDGDSAAAGSDSATAQDTAQGICNHTLSASDTSIRQGKNSHRKHIILPVAILLCAALALGVFATIHNRRNSNVCTVTVGDTVTFGSYNGEPVEWRVLRLSEDHKHAVLVSARILTMKAYDAAESGKYNHYDGIDYWSQDSEADTNMTLQAMVRGSNIWSGSNIRTWLNCAEEVVTYADQPPHAAAMAEHKNGYQHEAGFLYGFTSEELDAIEETEHATKSNILYDADTVTTTDRVYLLSLDELQWFDDAKISKFAKPTKAAVEQDESCWYLLDYNTFHIEEGCWWLREPVEDTASMCYLVGNGYTEELLRQENVGLEGFGIRPAVTVDLRKVSFGSE